MPRDVTPIRLLVRCVALREGDQWQAFTLEFGLAAQADSFQEARQKIDAMIQDYLYEALVGDDREHASVLLIRKALWWVYALYYYARIMSYVRRSMISDKLRVFGEPWAMEPTKLTDGNLRG